MDKIGTVSLVVIIYRREGGEDRIIFELQRGNPSRRVGPFVSRAATKALSRLLDERDRAVWDLADGFGRGNDGFIADRCLSLPEIGNYILQHPHVFVKTKKFGSIKPAEAGQKCMIAALCDAGDLSRPVGVLSGGELRIVEYRTTVQIEVRWRYKGVPQSVHSVWESGKKAAPSLLVTVEGTIVRRDAWNEENLTSILIERLGSGARFQADGMISLPDLASLASLPRSEWTILLGRKEVTIRSAKATPTGISWFGGEVIAAAEHSLPVQAIAEAYLAGRGYVEAEGSLIVLPKELLSNAEPESLVSLLTFQDHSVPASDIAGVRKTFSKEERAALVKLLGRAGFSGTLRPFQVDGVLWMRELKQLKLGGVLADEMGLGKTVQALAFIASCYEVPAIILIIAPASVTPNWLHEIQRFVPGSVVVDDPGRIPNKPDNWSFVVLSYQAALNRGQSLRNIDFDLVILDEAQFVKNMWTKTAAVVRQINARSKIVLTGTPIENSLDDLWAHLTFLNPFLKRPYARLSKEIASFGRSAVAADLSKRAFSGLIMRRTKREVAADMPPLVERIVYCRMDSPQAKVYTRTLTAFKHMLGSSVAGRVYTLALEGLLRLRQCCASPSLLPQALNPDFVQSSVKIDLTIDHLVSAYARGEKTIVFSQFNGILDILESMLGERAIGYVRIDGSTLDRRTPVDKFQDDPAISVFLMAFRAGGVGINLTAAENVILFDPWWNPAAEQQAFARAHRIGQRHAVVVTKFVCHNSVEEKMLDLLALKKSISDAVLDELPQLSAKEIVQLFQDDIPSCS